MADPLYVRARAALLDAVEALDAHRDALAVSRLGSWASMTAGWDQRRKGTMRVPRQAYLAATEPGYRKIERSPRPRTTSV